LLLCAASSEALHTKQRQTSTAAESSLLYSGEQNLLDALTTADLDVEQLEKLVGEEDAQDE
jgi:hypothetical protein